MSVKQMAEQELQEQVDMRQDFAACAMAFAQSAQKIAAGHRRVYQLFGSCQAGRGISLAHQ